MNESIVDKIKKLLRLGQSSNPHEAKLALERAFELAMRHSIDVSSLDLDEEVEKIVHEWFRVGHRITLLKRRVLGIIQTFFNVTLCRSGARIVFVGTGTDIAIAWYVFDFLVDQGNRRLKEFIAIDRAIGRRNTKRKRESFVQGFVYGVSTQLKKQSDQIALDDSKFAIVRSEHEKVREAHLDQVIPNRRVDQRKLKDSNESALVNGYQRGRETQIRQPLTRPTEQLLLT